MIKKYLFVYIYILMVIIPTLIISYLYYHKLLEDDFNKRENQSNWIATIHQRSWDNFIGETVTASEMLSISAQTFTSFPEEMHELLKEVKALDPRYGELYLLNAAGKIISSSDGEYSVKSFAGSNYIKEVVRTKDIIISDYPEVLKDGQKVISIASPVLDKKSQLQYIIVTQLRIDYLLNIMNQLTPEGTISILNSNNETIFVLNKDVSNGKGSQPVILPIDRLPWSISVSLPFTNKTEIGQSLSMVIVLVFILCHALFLLFKYARFRKQAIIEKRENETQKLELVGTLAASTAHEIRNPLTGIKGLVQLLNEKYKDKEDQYYFSVINTEIQRINEIVSEFLILGKPTVQKKDLFDLKNILKELKPLIISEGNLNNVNCSFHLPTESVLVECSKDQMKQVILNVTKNALESMNNNQGDLTVELSKQRFKAKLTIIDTGEGIPEKEISKIFDPFYTSKETGTGLGLVVCKRIIHSFSGDIVISSKIGKGTKVEIILPLK